MDFEKLIREQEKMKSRIVLDRNSTRLKFVCGVDVSYSKREAYCCAVMWDIASHQLLDRSFVKRNKRDLFPYKPGFLCYREGDMMVDAIRALKKNPDVVLVDGNGILHPRKFGLACYVGVNLDVPTAGVAKKLLCGNVVGNDILLEGELVGRVVESKTGSKLYVSPGTEWM